MAPLLSVQKSSEGELRRACVGGKGAREMAMAGERMRSGEEWMKTLRIPKQLIDYCLSII